MPTVVVTHPDGSDEALEMGDELTIGRGNENGLVLPGHGVSRGHARLFVHDDGQVYVEDLGSSNGTYLAGERIYEPTLFEPQTPLVIGDYTLMLRAERPRSPRSSPHAALARSHVTGISRARPNRLVLRGMTGPWLNEIFPIDGVCRVGRAADVDLRLDDDSVSRQHAELQAGEEGLSVRDLGAANGTLLNGEPVIGEVQLTA